MRGGRCAIIDGLTSFSQTVWVPNANFLQWVVRTLTNTQQASVFLARLMSNAAPWATTQIRQWGEGYNTWWPETKNHSVVQQSCLFSLSFKNFWGWWMTFILTQSFQLYSIYFISPKNKILLLWTFSSDMFRYNSMCHYNITWVLISHSLGLLNTKWFSFKTIIYEFAQYFYKSANVMGKNTGY